MDSKMSGDTHTHTHSVSSSKHFLLQCFVLMTSEVRMRNIHTNTLLNSIRAPSTHQL